MHPEQSQVSWRMFVGELGELLPRIKKRDKQELKRNLAKAKTPELDRPWLVRLAIASGSPLPTNISGEDVRRALHPVDIARFLDRFAVQERVLSLANAFSNGPLPKAPAEARRVLAGLTRFVQGRPSKRRVQAPTRLSSDTALTLLKYGTQVVLILLGDGSSVMRRPKLRKRIIRQAVDFAYLSVIKSETPHVAGAAVELLVQVEKRVGGTELEQATADGPRRASYIYALPGRLIEGALLKGCLVDAETLASRLRLAPEAITPFRQAVEAVLARPELPAFSRQWAEGFLQLRPVVPANVDASDEVNIERMATLLLAAWEAREDGPRAGHYFDLFSSICASAFSLRLDGSVGATVGFDPMLHHSQKTDDAVQGKPVRILRPWVQWGQEPILRIIVPAMVAPVHGDESATGRSANGGDD